MPVSSLPFKLILPLLPQRLIILQAVPFSNSCSLGADMRLFLSFLNIAFSAEESCSPLCPILTNSFDSAKESVLQIASVFQRRRKKKKKKAAALF